MEVERVDHAKRLEEAHHPLGGGGEDGGSAPPPSARRLRGRSGGGSWSQGGGGGGGDSDNFFSSPPAQSGEEFSVVNKGGLWWEQPCEGTLRAARLASLPQWGGAPVVAVSRTVHTYLQPCSSTRSTQPCMQTGQ